MSGSGFLARQREIPARSLRSTGRAGTSEAVAPKGRAGVDYPWAGQPRRFSAIAMPSGDPGFGVEGELVQIQTFRGGGDPKLQMLSRGEADQLMEELRKALRVFDLAPRLVEGMDDCGPTAALHEGAGPTPCHAAYPFTGHRTLDVVDAPRPEKDAA